LSWDEEVGREKLGGLEGGDDRGCRGEELQPTAVAVSDVAACGGELAMGDSGRKGPSKAWAGDSGRLPGMVSRIGRAAGRGGDEWMTARIS
jgi:hypothetical protein